MSSSPSPNSLHKRTSNETKKDETLLYTRRVRETAPREQCSSSPPQRMTKILEGYTNSFTNHLTTLNEDKKEEGAKSKDKWMKKTAFRNSKVGQIQWCMPAVPTQKSRDKRIDCYVLKAIPISRQAGDLHRNPETVRTNKTSQCTGISHYTTKSVPGPFCIKC